jgi:hypothetical protein
LKSKFIASVLIALNVSLVFQIGCALSQNLNDFFGIEMAEEEAAQFKIVSYDKDRGANYYSNSRMNTQLYAWAEFEPQIIKIKVVNMTESNVSINYNMDQFTVVNDEDEEFILIKEDRLNYPSNEVIAPGKSVEYSLELPMKFWQTAGISSATEADPNSYQKFWKGENSLQLVKEKIKMIKLKLGGEKILIMKPVP